MLFPTLGSLVFAVFRCSQLWEHPKIIKIVVPKVGNARFSHFPSLPKLGTPIFVKFGASQTWDKAYLKHLIPFYAKATAIPPI